MTSSSDWAKLSQVEKNYQNEIWVVKRRVYGQLLAVRKENPRLYYQLKREMLQEDAKTFATIFRGVEKNAIKEVVI